MPILYGMPTPEMAEASGRDEFTLGGCMVTEGAPTHECLACGHKTTMDQSPQS